MSGPAWPEAWPAQDPFGGTWPRDDRGWRDYQLCVGGPLDEPTYQVLADQFLAAWDARGRTGLDACAPLGQRLGLAGHTAMMVGTATAQMMASSGRPMRQ